MKRFIRLAVACLVAGTMTASVAYAKTALTASTFIHYHTRVVTIHIWNQTHYKRWYLDKVERAIEYQANEQLRPIWHTPKIRFDNITRHLGPWGPKSKTWIVDLEPHPFIVVGWGSPAGGIHYWFKPQVLINIAAYDPNPMHPMSLLLSHEVLEALVDPTGRRWFVPGKSLVEICDPVEEEPGYKIDGVTVEGFVTPRWFNFTNTGAFDWKNTLSEPGQVIPYHANGYTADGDGDDDGS